MNVDMLKKQLIVDEGKINRLYKDTVGKTTGGVGHNFDDNILSEAVIDLLLTEDINTVVSQLDAALPWWRCMSQNRQLVLANMCFNMGIGNSQKGLLSFRNTLIKMQKGDYSGAAEGMRNSTWASQVGDRAKRLIETMRNG